MCKRRGKVVKRLIIVPSKEKVREGGREVIKGVVVVYTHRKLCNGREIVESLRKHAGTVMSYKNRERDKEISREREREKNNEMKFLRPQKVGEGEIVES